MGVGSSKQQAEEADRILVAGRPNLEQCDNKITTYKYTIWSFLPVAISEQFRRFANMYFLLVGCIMAIGWYTDLYESAISPWTTLGPLGFVVSLSLLVQGLADAKRHKSDNETNNASCVILRRGEEIDNDEDAEREESIREGKDVIVNLSKSYALTSSNQVPNTPVASASKPHHAHIGFQKIRRMDIRQGHIILVKNREMLPADMILLASSGDNGSSYIETSSIDGETNLKLRTSPHLPRSLMKHLREGTPMDVVEESADEDDDTGVMETLEQATKRIARFSALAYPNAKSAFESPAYMPESEAAGESKTNSFFARVSDGFQVMADRAEQVRSPSNPRDSSEVDGETFIAGLKSEPPNPHVNTFSGLLLLPPVSPGGPCHEIPLGAENILLRGAVVRNTEWVIGLACFTGTDTKLVQNSFETPSKFSQLDSLINKTVIFILFVMFLIMSYLATSAVVSMEQEFDNLWYVGFNTNTTSPWPYLQNSPGMSEPPAWMTSKPNWFQMFFLFITLLSNFVPLSLYVTVEFVNFFLLYLVYVDQEMYDDRTDTRAVARSVNITDLGQVEYIFSDKTGTLTQNVMRFKRCSVDGMVFGAPIQKARPKAETVEEDPNSGFHPLRRLLVGQAIGVGSMPDPDEDDFPDEERLTFNSEMFLRVMSLCHTVVVEKDLDLSANINANKSVSSKSQSSRSSYSSAKKYAKKFFGGSTKRDRTMSGGSAKRDRALSEMSANSAGYGGPMDTVAEEEPSIPVAEDLRLGTGSVGSLSMASTVQKGKDGAPTGFAYQAESPDEGALVSAASRSFGFQVVGRDSSGIKLKCAHPTIFSEKRIVDGIKSGNLSPQTLAAESAGSTSTMKGQSALIDERINDPNAQRTETWSILAVNKFDSERKRMSIVLRSPPELGGFAIVLCKGADSAMLDPTICTGAENLVSTDDTENVEANLANANEESEEAEWSLAQMLGLQAHLGEFASEGLRTLVLGMRFLTDEECENWLEIYKTAATSIKNREAMLTDAALKLECNLHIVGATAIEDKLQVGVGDTIATLAKAGIKLWVLTGDKRETAIEIGYSSHVLTPKMHVIEVADRGPDFVRAQCAMEFIRLVKAGNLPNYQRSAVDQSDGGWTRENLTYVLGKFRRNLWRKFRVCIIRIRLLLAALFRLDDSTLKGMQKDLEREEQGEYKILRDIVRRRHVRDRAEEIIKTFLSSPEGLQYAGKKKGSTTDPSLSPDDVPSVFQHAKSARALLERCRSEGRLSGQELRSLSITQLTAKEMETEHDQHIFDEDALSLDSFFPISGDAANNFDRRRRTILERLFAVDRDVRKGRLVKHLKKEKRTEALASPQTQNAVAPSGDGPRALVIEGAALKHLLGDPELEELIFSVASQCEAVIACRVSPRQKALLVGLVRHNISPEPVTLAIGDGANDVGMIQEAHVGIGISGKEGQQAVNASDFAIAQFRFLETLILIHGRWDFFRLSTVTLFSFYKNALMAGCLVFYNQQTVFSGEPLFDQWVLASLNFVAAWPIVVFGMFDRCLDKAYIRRNPQVYQASMRNELITIRVLLRWIILTFVHLFVLYYGTVNQLSGPGGSTSAFAGLMRYGDLDYPGDGEGGDLQSVGTVTYTALIFLLAYKVLFESRSIINGSWPLFTCKKGGESFASRLGYTWVAFLFGSILFYYFFLFMYELTAAETGPGEFFRFVDVPQHIMGTRSVNWLVLLLIPIAGIAIDVFGKVFSNMFYPTQTQIHVEIEAQERLEKNQL